MDTKGSMKIHPLNSGYTAMRFQGYDEEGAELEGCAETALTRDELGVNSAIRMVKASMTEHGYPNPEAPTGIEEFKETNV